MENKPKLLAQLKTKLLQDTSLPLRETAINLVIGEGNPDADLYFLGEAPGKKEDELGRPFIGSAGRVLEKLLAKIQLSREDVYISNIVRYRPPNNRPPKPHEVAAFADSVIQEITIVNPKLIIPLGRFPMGKFLPEETIGNVHGKLFHLTWQGRQVHVFPLYHPAASFRRTAFKQALEADFQKIPQILQSLAKS